MSNSLEVSLYVVKAGKVIQRSLEGAIPNREMSLSGWLVLDYLVRCGESPMVELVILLGSKANATEIISGLEKQGLLERFTPDVDRRTRSVRITSLGEVVADKNTPHVDGASATLLDSIDEQEQVDLRKYTGKILGAKATALLNRSNDTSIIS